MCLASSYPQCLSLPAVHGYTYMTNLGPPPPSPQVGPAATEELQKLQDAVPPFSNEIAYKLIEKELGRPWREVFSEISSQPIAAASLAQVYKGKLVSNGEYVAIKVQRPEMVATVSKDLYVMKKAIEVYQKYIVERFTAQTTDYQELLQVGR